MTSSTNFPGPVKVQGRYVPTLSADGRALVDGGGNLLIPALGGFDGASSAAAAAINTAIIQSGLSAGGWVPMYRPGVYEINDTLVIPSNTHLYLAPGVTIKQRSGTNKLMLASAAFVASATAITLSWSSGMSFTVNWTAHGKVVGDYVWIDNATINSLEQSKYKGVYRVASVPTADSFTVFAMRLPNTAPTTGFTCKAATVNAHVSGGGTWDYNFAGNPDGAATNKHAMIFAGVMGCSVAPEARFANLLKYAVNFGASRAGKWGCVAEVSGTDGDIIKGYGPSYGDIIHKVTGRCGDDGVSLQTREPAAFAQYMFSYGDIIGSKIQDINLECSDTSAISIGVLYCSPGEWADGVVFDGIHGRAGGNAVRVQPGDGLTGSVCGKVTILNVDANSTLAAVIGGGSGSPTFTVGQVEIGSCSHNPKTITDSCFEVKTSVTIQSLTVRDSESAVDSLASPTWPTGSAAVYLLIGGTVNVLNAERCNMNAVAANGRFIQLSNGSAARQISLVGCRLYGNQGVNVIATPAIVPHITYTGCDLDLAYAVNAPASVDVVMMGNTLNGATVGVRQTAGTATLAHGGNKLNGTAALTSGTVAATAW